jgi:hypothetical protein
LIPLPRQASFRPNGASRGFRRVMRESTFVHQTCVGSCCTWCRHRNGAPIVASCTPPVEEVIEDGVSGRLVAFFDMPGWSAALTGALANPAALHPLAQAARERVVERYDLSACLPKWIGFVERQGPGVMRLRGLLPALIAPSATPDGGTATRQRKPQKATDR